MLHHMWSILVDSFSEQKSVFIFKTIVISRDAIGFISRVLCTEMSNDKSVFLSTWSVLRCDYIYCILCGMVTNDLIIQINNVQS